MQIALASVIICAITVFGFLTQRLTLSAGRLSIYLFMVATLALTQLLGAHDFSLPSLLMVLIIHLPYAFLLRGGLYQPEKEVKIYIAIVVILSLFGVAQFFLQFLSRDLAFFFSTSFPQALLLEGFNSLNPVSAYGPTLKSNGFFLPEPSTFSQILAIGLIYQVIVCKNLWRSALFLLALALTFSGTGLVILFLLIPIYLLHKKRIFLLLFLGIITFTAPIWAPIVGLEKTVSRSTEVVRQGSSGYARFIAPALLIDRSFEDGAQTVMFGNGAGSIIRSMHPRKETYETHNPTWSKMIYEYGIIGSIVYFLFIGYIFFSSGKSMYLITALAFLFLFMGEYVFSPMAHGLILSLLAWSRVPRRGHCEFELAQVNQTEEINDTKFAKESLR